MKKTELRIGNFVLSPKIEQVFSDGDKIQIGEQVPMPINSIHGDNTIRLMNGDESIGCFKLRFIEPIPLTEEWLKKIGFNEDHNYPTLWSKNEFSIWWYPERRSVMLHKSVPCNVNYRYVHQLQNVYFALTGEELVDHATLAN